jgi:hypothetical protein
MTRTQKEFFCRDQFIALLSQVTQARLRLSGVTLGDDLGLKRKRPKSGIRFPAAGVWKLAGG